MSDDRVKVTVSHGGRERRIPLAVRPALELSDEQVEFAESELMRIVRHVFQVPLECGVDLHDTEGGRIMTGESFRDPSYLPHFPQHWFLTTRAIFGSASTPLPSFTLEEDDELEEKPSQSNGTEVETVAMETLDEPLVSLAELSYSEMKYKSVSIHCDSEGQFGFTLRHFTIQPANIPRSSTPDVSRTDSRCSMRSNDSLDALRLSSTFVHQLEAGGPAVLAGLNTGDVVHMINEVGVIRSSVEEVEDLLQQCGDDLSLLVLPKENDDLQFLYPQYTYGSAGEQETSDGRVCACDLPVVVGTESEILECKKPSSHLLRPLPANGTVDSSTENLVTEEKPTSPPLGLVPFNGSAQSLDHSLSNSNDNDILITGSLSEIPITLGPSKGGTWDSEVPHNDPTLGLEASSHDSLPALQQLSELSPTWHHGSEQSYSPRHELPLSSQPAASGLQFVSEAAAKFDSDWDDYLHSTSVPDSDHPKSEELQSSASDNFLTGRGARAERSALERDLQLRRTPLLPSRKLKPGLAVSTPALDRVGVSLQVVKGEMSRSTELGVFKLKKKGRQSLEALTRISTDEPLLRNRLSPIKRHRSDENALRGRTARGARWAADGEETVAAKARGSGSLQLGSQPDRVGSSQSTSEEQKTSQEGVVVAQRAPAVSKPRRGAKSYQIQREKLHKRSSLKSLTGSLDGGEEHHRPLRTRRRLSSRDEEDEGRGRRGSRRRQSFKSSSPSESEVKGQETPEQPQIPEGHEPQAGLRSRKSSRAHTYENVRPVIQETLASPPEVTPTNNIVTRNMRPLRERPASALEHSSTYSHYLPQPRAHPDQRLIQSMEVAGQAGVSRKIPLHHTRSAQTPFGEQEFTEVPIDEVIRSRQLLSPQGHSLDSGVVVSDRGGEDGEGGVPRKRGRARGIFAAGRSKLEQSRLLAASDERLFPRRSPSPTSRRLSSEAALAPYTHAPGTLSISTTCHGILNKKQERGADGKKSHDRSWKTYFAVLTGNQMIFYKDRKDAEMGKAFEEPPIDLVPSSTDIARDYSKKKFVFRVVTAQGAEFLLQAEDHESMRRWVGEVQRLNGGSPKPAEMTTLAASRAREVGGGKLAPPSSPTPFRRFASPLPNKNKKKDKDESSSKPKLLSKLRKTITKSRDTDGPETSGLATFGHLLHECPLSSENQNVPVVMEMCIKEVEQHGLRTEGIYRKAGPGSVVKMISAELDKGNYTLPDYEDIHVMSSLLKKFLKELPDPLIPVAGYDDFIACAREDREDVRMARFKELVYHLPTAHYHTLKYLMAHLKKVTSYHDVNKMSLRNVALVFGPTLVRNPMRSADLLVSAINAGYTVIEVLCRHVEQLFASALCAEEEAKEKQFQEQLAAMADEEARMRTSSEPSVSVHELRQQQKDNALWRASPKMVRRIRNDLNSRRASLESAKVLATDISLPLQRKQQNWDPTETLRSNRSSGSSLPSPGYRSPEVPYAGHTPPHQAKRIVIQNYDESASQSSASQRTKHWVNQHYQMEWGEGGERREAGSMWKSKELVQAQKEKKDRKRLSMTRGQVLTLSYQGSQDSYPSPARSSTFPNRSGSTVGLVPRGSTLPAVSPSQGQPARRRVSYLTALGDNSPLHLSEEPPVHGVLRSERYHSNYTGRGHVDGSRRFEATYHHDHRPHHRLMRVKSSEDTGEPRAWRREYPYHVRTHHDGATPPDRNLHSPQPPISVHQLESYL